MKSKYRRIIQQNRHLPRGVNVMIKPVNLHQRHPLALGSRHSDNGRLKQGTDWIP